MKFKQIRETFAAFPPTTYDYLSYTGLVVSLSIVCIMPFTKPTYKEGLLTAGIFGISVMRVLDLADSINRKYRIKTLQDRINACQSELVQAKSGSLQKQQPKKTTRKRKVTKNATTDKAA